jgi:hypothetical protein
LWSPLSINYVHTHLPIYAGYVHHNFLFQQKEPELLHGNDEVWQFVIHAGEDHTNIQTLVSFLRLLSTLVKKLKKNLLYIGHYQKVPTHSLVATENGTAHMVDAL